MTDRDHYDYLYDGPSGRDVHLVEVQVHRPVATSLRADVYEEDGMLVIEAEVPGLRPGEVEVTVNPRVLQIRGIVAEVVGNRVYRRRERGLTRAYREIPLPVAVRHEAVEATLHDGILRVSMPIREGEPAAADCRVPVGGGISSESGVFPAAVGE